MFITALGQPSVQTHLKQPKLLGFGVIIYLLYHFCLSCANLPGPSKLELSAAAALSAWGSQCQHDGVEVKDNQGWDGI